MKKTMVLLMALLMTFSVVLSGCGSKTEDPGPPPEDVISPGSTSGGSVSDGSTSSDSNEAAEGDSADVSDAEISDTEMLEGAVQVSIGQGDGKTYTVDMYNNAAVNTMLGYLTGSTLLFPSTEYDEEQGFAAHNIRGTYTQDDEITVTDIRAGDIYLFSGGQLRLYFKDVAGADITATPVGYFTETDDLTETVIADHEANRDDIWGVEVYFSITKMID